MKLPPRQSEFNTRNEAENFVDDCGIVNSDQMINVTCTRLGPKTTEVEIRFAYSLLGSKYEAIATTGVANCDPADTFDPQIGFKLAASRAFGNLSSKLARQANGMVSHAEHTASEMAMQAALRDYHKLTAVVENEQTTAGPIASFVRKHF